MTCKEMVEFLMAYLDRELPEAQRASFESHIDLCPPCQVYLDTYRQTVSLGKLLCEHEDDPVPDDVPEALVRAILAARRQEG
ncbi:MAG: hypothetical protein HKP30_08580 [Myxococcales bacterium]|nr:hypothetical protein [Myxococcales bacterium]